MAGAASGLWPQEPNATPVVDILKAFSLNCLVGGTRFAHVVGLQFVEPVCGGAQERGRSHRGAQELLLIPAKMVLSGRREIVKLVVGKQFASFPKQSYRRLEEWLSRGNFSFR